MQGQEVGRGRGMESTSSPSGDFSNLNDQNPSKVKFNEDEPFLPSIPNDAEKPHMVLGTSLDLKSLSTLAAEETAKEENLTSLKRKPKWHRFLGLLLTILSAMMFSINALIFKILQNYHPLTIASWMFIGTGILALPAYSLHRFRTRRPSHRPSDANQDTSLTLKKFLLLLTRSFSGCFGMSFFFYSLQYLSIGDALVIACSSSVFVFLLAFLFLKENCGIIPVVTIILALIGVVVITRPPLLTGKESFQTDDLIGAGLAFASMLCITSTLILMRYLQDVHHTLINLIFGSWGSIQTVLMALALGVLKFPQDIFDSSLIMTTGLLFFIGQTFLALALQLEEAGPVSLLRTSEVVFAFIWQFLFLNVYPDAFSITGALLIMIGIVTTILRKWIASLPANHKTRKTFAFILK